MEGPALEAAEPASLAETPTKSSLNISVTKLQFAGPTVYAEKQETLRTRFDGVRIETPEKTFAVIRGGLTGETYFVTVDHATGEENNLILPSSCLDRFLEASKNMPPQEQAELIEAVQHITQVEKDELKERIATAGGRDKFILSEAERLVAEGKYANVTEARSAVVNELEVFPRSKRAQEALENTAETGEMPQDINEPQEIEQLKTELTVLSSNGKLMELARRFPKLLRSKLDPKTQAEIALALAKEGMIKTLGEEAQSADGKLKVSELTLSDAEIMARSSLEFFSKPEEKPSPELSAATLYLWSVVAKLAKTQSNSVATQRPRIV